MGVSGLFSYVERKNLLKPFQLFNTIVIIDGINLCHFLYRNAEIKNLHMYAGDYDRFYHEIDIYFSTLNDCKVLPRVIFDGAKDVFGRTIDKISKRRKNRLANIKKISQSGNGDFVIPVLALDVFKVVLKELKVEHAQSTYEADDLIAALAKLYNCPVLSSDNDFLLYDIPGGCINLESLQLKLHEREGYKFLNCSIYYVKEFLKIFPRITFDVLPLFSVLLGNDYDFNDSTNQTIQKFFEEISSSNIKHGHIRHRHKCICALLQWLEGLSLENAMQRLKKKLLLSDFDQQQFEEYVKNLDDGYKRSWQNVQQFGKSVSLASMFKDVFTVPAWPIGFTNYFMGRFHTCDLPPFVGNVLVHRKVNLSIFIGDHNQPSANISSLPFRKAIYNILLSGTKVFPCTVEEEDRQGNKLCPRNVECEQIISAPKLFEMRNTKLELRRNFLLEIFSCEFEQLRLFPTSLQLLVSCLQFIIKGKNPLITDEFLSSVLLSCILISLNENFRDFSVEIKPLKVGYEDRNRVKNILDSFLNDHISNFTCRTIHNYSQLQSCLQYSSILNTLLLKPLPNAKIHNLCSGSFIHAMSCCLESQNEPEIFISELLKPASQLELLYKHFKEALLQIIPPNSLIKVKDIMKSAENNIK